MVATYHSTADNAAFVSHCLQRSVQRLTANVLVVDINSIGSQPLQGIRRVLLLVVRAGVKAELLGDELQLLVGTHGADDPQALVLRDLADDLADRASRTADEDGLALLGLADLEETRPGRQAGHAEVPDEDPQVEVVRVADLVGPLGLDELLLDVGVLGDRDDIDEQVALLEARGV